MGQSGNSYVLWEDSVIRVSLPFRPITICAIWLALPQVARSDDILHDSTSNHQATVDAIRTFRCRVSVSFNPARPWGADTSEYWRVGNSFRCRSRSGGVTTDSSFRDGVTKLYTNNLSQGGKARSGQITTKDMAYSCDAWSYGLLSYYGRDRFRVGLRELIGSEGTRASATHVNKDGRRLVRIDVSHARADLQIWLDPSVNYLARYVKTKTKPQFGMSDGLATVDSFQEVAPGVFFPVKVHCEIITGEERKKSGWVAELADVKINHAIAEKDLEVRFPQNLLVGDEIRNGVFRTNADGIPSQQAVNSEGRKLILSSGPPVPIADPDAQIASVTKEEPLPRSRWILRAAIALLALAVVLSVARRIRGRQRGAVTVNGTSTT